jgi:hypothetical protein
LNKQWVNAASVVGNDQDGAICLHDRLKVLDAVELWVLAKAE